MSDDCCRAELVAHPPEAILDYTIQELVNDVENVSFYLPYQWSNTYGGKYERNDGIGNPCPEDPLTVYWSADVSGNDERVTYKTTIGALLDDTFELHELCHESPTAIGSSSVPLFIDIRDALQKEVDRLNLWIDNAKSEDSEV